MYIALLIFSPGATILMDVAIVRTQLLQQWFQVIKKTGFTLFK